MLLIKRRLFAFRQEQEQWQEQKQEKWQEQEQ